MAKPNKLQSVAEEATTESKAVEETVTVAAKEAEASLTEQAGKAAAELTAAGEHTKAVLLHGIELRLYELRQHVLHVEQELGAEVHALIAELRSLL